MNLDVFKRLDIQTSLIIIKEAISEGINSSKDIQLILEEYLRNQEQEFKVQYKAIERKNRFNLRCSICGGFAIESKLNTGRGDKISGYTHVIQCQNRPAINKPWLKTHCGHTEYISRGSR